MSKKDGKDEGLPGISKTAKIIRTVVAVSGWLCMGLYSEVSGPALPYLKYQVNSNYEEISRALVARSVGFLVGALAGGVLCQKYRRHIDLWMALSLALAAVGTAVVPWCRNLPLLATMFALDGTGKGILAAGSNAFILALWGDEASAPCHSLHFAFGVGALIVPQIARPFLPELPDATDSANITVVLGNTSLLQTTSTASGYALSSQPTTPASVATASLEYPFTIVAAITMLCALANLALFWCLPLRGNTVASEKPPPLKKMLNPSTCVPGSKVFAVQFLLLLSILFALPIGAERVYGKFIFAYSVEGPPKFSKDDGTLLETVFWSAFTAGRGVSTIAAKWIPALYLLLLELAMNLMTTLLLAILGSSHEIVLWVFTGLFAAFLSPVFPTVLSWANLRISLTPMVTSMAFIASAAGAFVFSWLGGSLFQGVGPHALMYILVGYSITLSLIFALTFFLARLYGTRKSGEQQGPDAKDAKVSELEALKGADNESKA